MAHFKFTYSAETCVSKYMAYCELITENLAPRFSLNAAQ